MPKTIRSIPDHLTRKQYTDLVEDLGFTPQDVTEMRFTPQGVHVTVFAKNQDGQKELDRSEEKPTYLKHLVFIPIHDEEQES